MTHARLSVTTGSYLCLLFLVTTALLYHHSVVSDEEDKQVEPKITDRAKRLGEGKRVEK
jgi:hypothetical protein